MLILRDLQRIGVKKGQKRDRKRDNIPQNLTLFQPVSGVQNHPKVRVEKPPKKGVLFPALRQGRPTLGIVGRLPLWRGRSENCRNPAERYPSILSTQQRPHHSLNAALPSFRQQAQQVGGGPCMFLFHFPLDLRNPCKESRPYRFQPGSQIALDSVSTKSRNHAGSVVLQRSQSRDKLRCCSCAVIA
jgi:hypothetical protein